MPQRVEIPSYCLDETSRTVAPMNSSSRRDVDPRSIMRRSIFLTLRSRPCAYYDVQSVRLRRQDWRMSQRGNRIMHPGRMNMLSTEDRIALARRELERHGTVSTGLLPPDILESWKRCADVQLDPSRPPPLQIESAAVLRSARQRHEVVLRLAMAEMQ